MNPPASSGSTEQHAPSSEPQCRATLPTVSNAAPSADFDHKLPGYRSAASRLRPQVARCLRNQPPTSNIKKLHFKLRITQAVYLQSVSIKAHTTYNRVLIVARAPQVNVDILIFVHIALIRSRLEYVSFTWNNLTLANSSKVENIQGTFANLCYSQFIQLSSHNYDSVLNNLKFRTLNSGRKHFGASFLANVSGTKSTVTQTTQDQRPTTDE
jgi:hypothetical protein